MRRIISIFLLGVFAESTSGHGGGLDASGGHFNRKTGEYHCHREPCISNQVQTRQATNEAEGKGRRYSTIYDRDGWGGWIDADGDCQNTRAEILIRDSKGPIGLEGCRVVSGLWELPYSGGSTTQASVIDIDHIIPLNWAHHHGGANWNRAQKVRFANDPENLLATSASANRSKGALGPGSWMPDLNQCDYLDRWRKLLEKYQLQPGLSDQAALNRDCGL